MIAKRSQAKEGRPALQDGRHRYVVYGIGVDSSFPMSSLPIGTGNGAPSVRLDLAPADYFVARKAGLEGERADWIQHAVLDDGSVFIGVEGVFQTIVSRDGRQVACGRPDDIDDRSFEANLLNFALSTSLTLQGEEPLHATVVDLGGRAAGLLGQSGAGKSTLAAYLISQGADLITDDMLRLDLGGEGAMAFPGPYRLKLFEEPAQRFLPGAARHGAFNALSGKVMIRPRPGGQPPLERTRLSALFWLGEPAPQVAARPLSGAALAKALIASAMDIRYYAPDRLARQMRFAEQVGRNVPVYELIYPRQFAVMDEVAGHIRRLAGA